MASRLNNSKIAKSQLEEKLQDIKRSQSNWMKERKESQEKEIQASKRDDKHERQRPKKINETKKKEPDTISWIVSASPKATKKTSLRSRSASPSRTIKFTNTQKEIGKTRTNTNSRPSSGTSTSRSRPVSASKSNTSSRPPSGKLLQSSRSNYENMDDDCKNSDNLQQLHLQETEHKNNLSVEIPHLDDISDRVLPTNEVREAELVSQSGKLFDDVMLKQLADKVTDRVKSELILEKQDKYEKLVDPPRHSILDDGDQVDGHLCTKCKQLMVPPDHTPTLLVPCGHTFCEACAEDRIKCPSCRTKVTSTTINTALQEVIYQVNSSRFQNKRSIEQNSYNPSRYATKNKTTSGSTNQRYEMDRLPYSYDCRRDIDQLKESHIQSRHVERYPETFEHGRHQLPDRYEHGRHVEKAPDSQEQGKFYKDQFDGLVIRCEALRNEEIEIKDGLKIIQTNYEKERKVLSNIEKEEERLTDEIRKMRDKLEILNDHKQEYIERCNELEKQKTQETSRLDIVKETLTNHIQNMEKVKMLARNFNISIE